MRSSALSRPRPKFRLSPSSDSATASEESTIIPRQTLPPAFRPAGGSAGSVTSTLPVKDAPTASPGTSMLPDAIESERSSFVIVESAEKTIRTLVGATGAFPWLTTEKAMRVWEPQRKEGTASPVASPSAGPMTKPVPRRLRRGSCSTGLFSIFVSEKSFPQYIPQPTSTESVDVALKDFKETFPEASYDQGFPCVAVTVTRASVVDRVR